jgi:hypothetical protein
MSLFVASIRTKRLEYVASGGSMDEADFVLRLRKSLPHEYANASTAMAAWSSKEATIDRALTYLQKFVEKCGQARECSRKLCRQCSQERRITPPREGLNGLPTSSTNTQTRSSFASTSRSKTSAQGLHAASPIASQQAKNSKTTREESQERCMQPRQRKRSTRCAW